jgi:hypothetical protein
MRNDHTAERKSAADLTTAVQSVDGWLERLNSAFDVWSLLHDTREPAGDLWRQVLRWHAAFNLSFQQLAQRLDDLTDVSDVQLALAQASESCVVDGVRMLPLARQRLRALLPELQAHLVQTHLRPVFTGASSPDAERVNGLDDVYRIRAHACRMVYHQTQYGPLILAVTAEHWPHPLGGSSAGSLLDGREPKP